MDLYSVRILRKQPLRLALTVGGIALCLVLMLFLLSVYQGVADGSVEYIRQNKADLWVLQRNATNILRGSSVLFASHGKQIQKVSGVQSVFPVLLLLSAVKKDDKSATVFLTGYDPTSRFGGPPELAEGRLVKDDGEIVLDQAFVKKYHFKVGDSVQIQGDTLRVVGISKRTNAFVTQYAFVTLHCAQSLIGFPGIVTCYLVKVKEGEDKQLVKRQIQEKLSKVEVYDHQEFLQNNIREMQSGFLPFIYTIAAIGVIVLTAVLSLLLSINILERRKDFAVMKTIGSTNLFLSKLIIQQALLISSAGFGVALALFFPLVALIERISPEVSSQSSLQQILVILLGLGGMSLISSFVSMQRLRKIYTLEVFS
jgi:putative ABC transport system permease protein